MPRGSVLRVPGAAPRTLLGKGLPASPGAASGTVVFSADEAESRAAKGEAVILVAGAPDTAPDPATWQAALAEAMEGQPLRAAVDDIAARFDLKRKDVYDAALALKAKA